jgi:hypothetical protein
MTVFTIDTTDLDSIVGAIAIGLTTPEQLAEAFPQDLELIDECVAIVGDDTIYADDGNAEIEYSGVSAEEAAQSYVDTGDWGDDEGKKTTYVSVTTYRKGVDADGDIVHIDEDHHTITIEAEEPDCVDGNAHQWKSPYSIVGGLKENPGVWGSGGGVVIFECCMLCGCKKTTDTWAQNPCNGEQGLTSVEYAEGEYTEEVDKRLIAKAKEALGSDEVDGMNFAWTNDDGELVDVSDEELREYGIRLRVDGEAAEKPTGTAVIE